MILLLSKIVYSVNKLKYINLVPIFKYFCVLQNIIKKNIAINHR